MPAGCQRPPPPHIGTVPRRIAGNYGPPADVSGCAVQMSEDTMTKIVLADDHAVVRSGLRLLLDADAGLPVEAVRTAAAGGRYLNPRLGAALAAGPAPDAGPPDDLTDREVEILRLIALGHTNAEIGKQLYLSVRTVESHRAHIQQKLRRSTRAELVRYALEHGLIETGS